MDLSGSLLILLNALVVVYWVGVAILIVSEDREPTSALA